MRKDLSPAIDAPRLSSYSKCDAVLATHGLHLPLFKSSRRRVLFPLTPGGRHLFISPVNAICCVSFCPVKNYPPVKVESPL